MADPDVLKFDDENFETEVINSQTPVLVDFWAEWCGPCQMLTPVISELATDYKGRIKVGKVDIDSARETAAKYGVQNIPTVILFDQGEPAETFVGVRRKGDYQTAVDAKLGSG